MGYFENIDLSNFRNFSQNSLEFINGCNVIVGKNGSGKTNILESISLFEKGRGLRKDKINNFINYSNINQGFNIYTFFNDNEIKYEVSVSNDQNNKKKILVNNSFESEIIKHFNSLFSIIFFLTEMERLFISTPSLRRNFLDRLIFNYNKNYNLVINKYKKAILERQLLLKNNHYDEIWIQNIENNIFKYGSLIYKNRINHLEILNKIIMDLDIKKYFKYDFLLRIDDSFLNENQNLYDDSELYLSILKKNRKLDAFSGSCNLGPHRSDISGHNIRNNFNINQFSTGEQKTVILLIIIAQSKYLIETLKIKPIILIDEVCSHLDDVNRKLLLFLIEELNVQIFMTGTDKNFFSFLSTKAHYCNIA